MLDLEQIDNMKKILLSLATLFLCCSPGMALASSSPFSSGTTDGTPGFSRFFEDAVTNQTVGSDLAKQNTNLQETLPRAIGRIINTVLGFVGIILLIIFLMAGFMWLTAGGNDTKVSQAKLYMRNAVIGMFLSFTAFALTSLIVVTLENILLRSSGA